MAQELKARLLGQTMNEYGCDTKIYLKSEADKVITELKAFVARKIDDGTCDPVPCVEVYLKSEADSVLSEKDATIAELKNEINRKEGVGQRWFERCMEARTENVRLKRALWLAREWRAWCEVEFWSALESNEPRDVYHLSCTSRIHRTPEEWITYWQKMKSLCEKKAEEYK